MQLTLHRNCSTSVIGRNTLDYGEREGVTWKEATIKWKQLYVRWLGDTKSKQDKPRRRERERAREERGIKT